MGRKGLKDLRVFLETQVDLGETQGLKDQSALRVPSVTQASRAITASKDPMARRARSVLRAPLENPVSKVMQARKVP